MMRPRSPPCDATLELAALPFLQLRICPFLQYLLQLIRRQTHQIRPHYVRYVCLRSKRRPPLKPGSSIAILVYISGSKARTHGRKRLWKALATKKQRRIGPRKAAEVALVNGRVVLIETLSPVAESWAVRVDCVGLWSERGNRSSLTVHQLPPDLRS